MIREEATLTSKGQVTVPKAIRDKLGLRLGDTIVYTLTDDGVVLTPKCVDFADLAGYLGRPPNGPATLAEIDETITRHAGRHASSGDDAAEDDAA